MRDRIETIKLNEKQLCLFYLGQVGFLIKYNDKYILIDAYLSDYVDKNCSNELVKWERNYPAPILANELDFVDYVFCTHTHYDHADPETLSTIAKVNSKAKFYISAPNKDVISRYGIDADRIIPMHINEEITLSTDIFATAIKSAHEEFHIDSNGDYLETGFILRLGSIKIYHAGDCCMYDGIEDSLKGCDILILPINGKDYYRTNVMDIIGCFDSAEAVTLAKNVNAKLLIPTHYDLYNVNCVNPAYFVDTLKRINPSQGYHLFSPGEGYIYSDDLF